MVMEKSAWMENIFYSTRPENANQKVLVGIHAHTIDILTEGGQVITTHKRVFGDNRSDVSDYTTTLAVLMKNSGAWGNSGLKTGNPGCPAYIHGCTAEREA